jgi:hypothetical protein
MGGLLPRTDAGALVQGLAVFPRTHGRVGTFSTEWGRPVPGFRRVRPPQGGLQ